MKLVDDVPANHWRWLRRWNPDAQQALDWTCRQFPPEVQGRGVSRAYYEFLWVLEHVLRLLPVAADGCRVFDAGCGAGVVSLALRRLGARVTVFDTFAEYGDTDENQMGTAGDIVSRFAANGIDAHEGSLVSSPLPVPEGTCDVVLFLAVIEHLHESPCRVLASLARLLKPGGLLVVTTPNHAWIRTRLRLLSGRTVHDPLPDWWRTPFSGHVREYTMPELTQMLEWTGLRVRVARTSNWWHVSSRVEEGRPGVPERWSTRFTLDSPSRLAVAGSLLLTSAFPSLRYTMLAVGQKADE